MKRKLAVLPILDVPSPCFEDWDQMEGDEKVRFCGQCNEHVHHLSAMTAIEAHEVLAQRAAGAKLCVRFSRDDRGAVLVMPEPSRPTSAARSRQVAAAVMVAASLAACRPHQEHVVGELVADPVHAATLPADSGAPSHGDASTLDAATRDASSADAIPAKTGHQNHPRLMGKVAAPKHTAPTMGDVAMPEEMEKSR